LTSGRLSLPTSGGGKREKKKPLKYVKSKAKKKGTEGDIGVKSQGKPKGEKDHLGMEKNPPRDKRHWEHKTKERGNKDGDKMA